MNLQIVHRRLAARNVLVDADHSVKITGFGPLNCDQDGDGQPKKRASTNSV